MIEDHNKFYSASGVTKKVAQVLAGAISADLYEIKPEVAYTQEDLNWKNKNSRSSVEMSDLKSRPALADKEAYVDNHHVIFVKGVFIYEKWVQQKTIRTYICCEFVFSCIIFVPWSCICRYGS